MSDEYHDIKIPSKFKPDEQAILGYLYDHPDESIETAGLVQILNKESNKQKGQSYGDVEYAIESLILSKLVRGKRTSKSGQIGYVKLRLTPKGEATAIQERRNAEGIRLVVTYVGKPSDKPQT